MSGTRLSWKTAPAEAAARMASPRRTRTVSAADMTEEPQDPFATFM